MTITIFKPLGACRHLLINNERHKVFGSFDDFIDRLYAKALSDLPIIVVINSKAKDAIPMQCIIKRDCVRCTVNNHMFNVCQHLFDRFTGINTAKRGKFTVMINIKLT